MLADHLLGNPYAKTRPQLPPLTDEERDSLEALIGTGLAERGREPDETEKAAARKLGLNPYDWHTNRWFSTDATR
jgi:hypothetical protein